MKNLLGGSQKELPTFDFSKRAAVLKEEGCSIRQMRKGGVPWAGRPGAIFTAGFTKAELEAGGWSLAKQKYDGCHKHGVNLTQLKCAGYTYDDCRRAGWPKHALDSEFGRCPNGGECVKEMKGDDGAGHPTHIVCGKCGATWRG